MAVVATGFFDGVHLGHRQVIQALVSTAREEGVEAVVVTFDRHPREVLGQDSDTLVLLSTLDERVSMLKGLGVDRVEVLPFTPEFASLSAERYVREILGGRFGATTIVMGYDNRLGSDRCGPEEIGRIASEEGMRTIVVPPFGLDVAGGGPVSSTRIRNLLACNDVADANAMLGYDYFPEVGSGKKE